MATKRVNQIVMAATAADFIAGRNGLIDTPEGTKRIPGNLLTFLGNVHFVSNAEYVFAVVDSNDTFLFGVKTDGSFVWSKGMSNDLKIKIESILNSLDNKVDKESGKSLINSVFASGISFESNAEYLFAALDLNKNILFGVKSDGSFYCPKDFRYYSYFNEILRRTNPLVNKNILIIGDSITDMGYWVNSLKSISGCKVYNRGVSGTTIADRSGSSQSFCQRFDLSESDSQTHTDGFPARENVDFVIVFGGTNDWGNSVPFGDFGENIDRATFFGALRYLINGLKTRYCGKPIFVMSPLNCARSLRFSNWNRVAFGTGTSFDFRVNSQSAEMSDYTDIMKAVCRLYGVFFIDMFNCGISPVVEYDYNHYFVTHEGDSVPDGLHPNEVGSAIIAKYVYKKLLTFI